MSKLSLPQPGDRFGYWIVLAPSVRRLRPQGTGAKQDWFTPCQCDCGMQRDVRTEALRGGRTVSCGCASPTKHGHTRGRSRGGQQSPEYLAWCALRRRCKDPKDPRYYTYGARGITVCPEWDDFRNFIRDMGPRPSPDHSIERIDNDLGYCAANCRWATRLEQANNKKNNVFLTWNGETLTISEWSRRQGIKMQTLYQRLLRGWSVELALTEPVQPWRERRKYG